MSVFGVFFDKLLWNLSEEKKTVFPIDGHVSVREGKSGGLFLLKKAPPSCVPPPLWFFLSSKSPFSWNFWPFSALRAYFCLKIDFEQFPTKFIKYIYFMQQCQTSMNFSYLWILKFSSFKSFFKWSQTATVPPNGPRPHGPPATGPQKSPPSLKLKLRVHLCFFYPLYQILWSVPWKVRNIISPRRKHV